MNKNYVIGRVLDGEGREYIAIQNDDGRVFFSIINSKKCLQGIAEFIISSSRSDGYFESYLDFGKYKELEIDTAKVGEIIYYYSVNHKFPQDFDFRFIPIG